MQFTTTILLAILAASTTLAAPVPAAELGAHLEARATSHFPIATRPKLSRRRDLEDTVELEARGRQKDATSHGHGQSHGGGCGGGGCTIQKRGRQKDATSHGHGQSHGGGCGGGGCTIQK